MQAVTEDLVRGLASGGHEVDLFTTDRPGQRVALEEEALGSLRIYYLRTGAPGRYSRAWFRAADRAFRERLASRRYEAVVTFSAAARGLLRRWRRSGIGLPTVLVTFGTHVDELRAGLRSVEADGTIGGVADGLLRVAHVVYRAIRDVPFMRSPDIVIASCPGDARKIRAVFGVPAARLRVIPYGVTALLRTQLQRAANLGGCRVVVLARLERDKGVQVCLRALRLVRASVPDVTLRVVGDGSYRPRLEALARELGVADIAEFVGNVPYERLAEGYAGAAVVVNPRLRPTAYDHALVVGMATGVPVITSDIGDVGFVASAGRDALLVPPGDPAALARALVTALTDQTLAERIGAAGRDRVQTAFTMEQTVAAYSQLLTALAHGTVA